MLSRRNTFGPLYKEVNTGKSSRNLPADVLVACRPYRLEPQGLLELPTVAEIKG